MVAIIAAAALVMRLVSKAVVVEVPVTGRGVKAAAAEGAAGETKRTMGMVKMLWPSAARMPRGSEIAPSRLKAPFIGTSVAAVVFTMQPAERAKLVK